MWISKKKYSDIFYINNGGWHFTCIRSPEELEKKLLNFAHHYEFEESGLKEKLLAAHRAGIKKVLIPFENKKDLAEIPNIIKNSINIIPVKNVDEVLKIALKKPLKRIEWVEVEKISKSRDQKSATSSRH